MREDRRDDLVSTTAIVAGAVVGVAVTILSLLLSGDERQQPDAAVVESMRAQVSSLEATCADPEGTIRVLHELSLRAPSAETARALLDGVDAALVCASRR